MFDFQEFEAILNDGELFINHTIDELRYLLVENFDETIEMFNNEWTQIEQEFGDLKTTIIQEIKLTELNNTAVQFLDVVEQFNKTAEDINNMIAVKDDLTQNIESILTQLGCDTTASDACDVLKAIQTQIGNVNFEIAPVSSEQLVSLKQIFADVTTALDEANITTVFGDITVKIDEVKNMLAEQADSLIGPIQDNIGDIFSETGSIVDDMKSVRDDFFPYFKTATLVLGSFFVVVLVVFLLGALCGSCSKRGGQSASGAATLLFSTNIVLILLAVLLFILTTGMFIFGAFSQKLLCKTLDDPANSELLNFASPLISKELAAVYGNDAVTIDVAEVIEGIHNGTALYPLLQLNYIYDINNLTDWETQFKVGDAIQEGRQIILDAIEHINNGVN